MSTQHYTFNEYEVLGLYKLAMLEQPQTQFLEKWKVSDNAEKQAIWDTLVNDLDCDSQEHLIHSDIQLLDKQFTSGDQTKS